MHAMPLHNGKLVATSLAMPEPAPGEIRLKLAYAGLNRADIFQREGRYPLPEETHNVPGLEGAGVVDALGDEVEGYQIGQPVCALAVGGMYADYAVMPAGQVASVPPGITLREAAALPEAYATSWLALIEIAQLAKGETVLIHGGASGIGTAAIQLAKLRGAQVITTVGSTEKAKVCQALGAQTILYQEEDFVAFVQEYTQNRGVQVVLDMVGGDYIAKNLKLLTPYGRMVTIALLQGARTEINAAPLLLKNIRWQGMTLRSRSVNEKQALLAALQQHVWPALSQGIIHPVIDRVFPLSEAEKAQTYMQEGLHIGKILLEMGA